MSGLRRYRPSNENRENALAERGGARRKPSISLFDFYLCSRRFHVSEAFSGRQWAVDISCCRSQGRRRQHCVGPLRVKQPQPLQRKGQCHDQLERSFFSLAQHCSDGPRKPTPLCPKQDKPATLKSRSFTPRLLRAKYKTLLWNAMIRAQRSSRIRIYQRPQYLASNRL